MKKITLALLLSALFSLLSADELTAEKNDLFTSDEDGAFDVSKYLASRYGFLPVPMLITEPAIGYGAGLNLMFLHDTFGSSLERKSPPSISGVAAIATENGTKVGAAYHLGFWNQDRLRTTSIAGILDVNMDFYLKNIGINMNLNGFFAYQEVMWRLGESNFFLGGNYMYSDVKSKRNDGEYPILNPLFEQNFSMGGLALVAQYDSRDTIFTPTKGLFAKATLRRFDENLGGTQNFYRYGAKAFYFTPLSSKLVLGLRAEGESVAVSDGESIPFFANPSINMRGIESMRYQGEKMLMGELQLRYTFMPRWNIVAFGGGGKVFGRTQELSGNLPQEVDNSFSQAEFHPAGGLGFRYELARKFGLWGGLDFARSQDEDLAMYITVGSAWGAF